MNVLAIDPGTRESAWIYFDGIRPLQAGIDPNESMMSVLDAYCLAGHLVIEKIVSYGRPVGQETFDTVLWVGRFMERFGADRTTLLERRIVRKH